MDTPDESEDKIEVLPSTETDNAPAYVGATALTDEQWRQIKAMLEYLVGYRDLDGHDPSKVFHKRVNKRNIPSYYEVIKEPMAFSNLKAKLANREYKTFSEFVRDCALIWHNAHTYNRPDAGAYQDASTIKSLMEQEFQKLVSTSVVTPEDVAWPELGEIPPVEDVPADDEEEEDDDDEDEDEEEEADDSEDEPKKRRRGRPSGSTKNKIEAPSKWDGLKADISVKKRRGRPPKVDTPMEARIKNVLKGLRKPKDENGNIMAINFEKLPDKAAMPEYYTEIKTPMSIEQIKKNQKRKRYKSLEQFMGDLDTMFENAKLFNEDDSQIYKDAVFLKQEVHRVAEIEKQKSDSEFVMEEGRKPRPEGILHNNELWKVGDWVHIQNANDVSKPIVAQIYRTWEDSDGQEWVNACWYYRPEQTVHQYEKHFYPAEVVKTGQYRDHPIDDVIDRCFVMFFTRFSRGRPRGISPNSEVYVCEARYNEEKHKLNKIKTWASCLPDEVRDKDYEMDLFESVKKVKKVPSPLLHMLKEDEKESTHIPKPRWGAENAPPVVGGIYKGPRDENQSPPPEPTPTPPPQPPPQQRQISQSQNQEMSAYRRPSEAASTGENTVQLAGLTPVPAHLAHVKPQVHTPQFNLQHHSQQSASPAPVQYQQPQAARTAYTPGSSQTATANNTARSYDHQYSLAKNRYAQQELQSQYAQLPSVAQNAQRSMEVFHLPDNANFAIPEEIRNRFHQDENGHVLFFSKPPLDILPPTNDGAPIGHSVRYRAAKLRKKLMAEMKRKEEQTAAAEAESEEGPSKRRKTTAEAEQGNVPDESMSTEPTLTKPTSTEPKSTEPTSNLSTQKLRDLAVVDALEVYMKEMERGTDNIYKSTFGEDWQEFKRLDGERIATRQKEAAEKRERLEKKWKGEEEKKREEERNMFKPPKVYLDDIDPRY